MGKRQVSILQTAATAVAEIAFFIENKGMPVSAKKFTDEAFQFFDRLADDRIEYRKWVYKKWREFDYRCVTYKKKYAVAFISGISEITICDFVIAKLLKE